MHQLRIVHLGGSGAPRFQVLRLGATKTADAVEVPSPAEQQVAGCANSNLLNELSWYLEEFLDYPFPPETEHAEQVKQALQAWGRTAFLALFNQGHGRDFYRDATRDGAEQLHLQIASDDPRILCWPWEALSDPDTANLGFQCGIERCLNEVADPPGLSANLPRDRVNILLVICRPFERDVGYRSVTRSLVELVEQHRLPAQVTVLRPPTFDRLREVLKQERGRFHIVHFDGHGGYGHVPQSEPSRPHQLCGPEGRLYFETDEGGPDAVSAEKLRELLREYQIPAVVLNACQSAKLDEQAEDPFASVAASLIKGGVRSVVAMSHSLYVSAAQRFLPAYYRTLFEQGDAAEAVRAGRRELFAHPERVCARGTHPLSDWMVPVVYQQEPLDLAFAKQAAERAPESSELRGRLPAEAQDDRNPYGFVGRDEALLKLERAMRRPPAGILIHGLGGVGKTTLARGFLKWLSQTGGLGNGALWLGFQDIRSAEYVINTITQTLFGPNALVANLSDKVEAVARTLKEHPFVLVWDNFESVCGIEGTSQDALLTSEDQAVLKGLLAKLRGGKTKVLITSRGREDWLGATNRSVVELSGLQGEERWEYCRVILRDLDRKANQDDPELSQLMDTLGGHPLMMRVVLSKLERMSAGEILRAVQDNLKVFDGADEAHQQLFATLRFVEKSLPEALRPLLVPLALHEHFVDADYLEAMAKQVPGPWSRRMIDELLATLSIAGLVTDRGQAIYELHPALTGYLKSIVSADDPSRDAWSRAFVDFMGTLADQATPKELHQQRFVFTLHGENFRRALGLAEKLGMDSDFAALTQSLAAFALNTRNFAAAERLFEQLGRHSAERGEAKVEAGAYHQLGRVAEERRDLNRAEQWYLKSLAIKEKQGNELGAASTYHQLGMVAQERRDFERAEQWYLKSLAIEEKQGNEHGAAITYHQLGNMAQERRDFERAEQWYLKSLAIKEKQGNEHGAATTYGQLGNLTLERRDFERAEQWYLKALAIFEKEGNEHAAAPSYHQLGIVAKERRDFERAEQWYLKSLAIEEKQDNEHGVATSYHQLGLLAKLRGEPERAGSWLLKAIVVFTRLSDSHRAQIAINSYLRTYRSADAALKPRLQALWVEAGLGSMPE